MMNQDGTGRKLMMISDSVAHNSLEHLVEMGHDQMIMVGSGVHNLMMNRDETGQKLMMSVSELRNLLIDLVEMGRNQMIMAGSDSVVHNQMKQRVETVHNLLKNPLSGVEVHKVSVHIRYAELRQGEEGRAS